MTPEQIEIVRSTWRAVLPIAQESADLFYDKLFLLDPRLRPLFPDDLMEPKRRLMSMIGRVVSSLHDRPGVVAALQDLGRRHVGYGTKRGDYATFGSAWLWSLEQGLGPAWTPEAREGWAAAYSWLAEVMIEAAENQLAQAGVGW